VTVLSFRRTRASVLVLNDCPDTLGLLVNALTSAGFRVHGSSVGDAHEEMDELVTAFTPDVVVYDIGPGGDEEWGNLRRFSERPEMEGAPLVITTTNVVKVEGQRDAVYVRSSLQFIATPYDVSDLVARVSGAIGLSALYPDQTESPRA
jgi:DNA-binding response OmpR family regulator